MTILKEPTAAWRATQKLAAKPATAAKEGCQWLWSLRYEVAAILLTQAVAAAGRWAAGKATDAIFPRRSAEVKPFRRHLRLVR